MNVNKKQGFTLVELLVVIGILGILSAALFPAIGNAMMQANMTAVGTRGKDIFVAIIGANTEREPLGLGNVWPVNGSVDSTSTGGDKDISETSFNNSSDYFYELLDGENMGKSEWSPYVAGMDYSKLAGAGVPAKSGTTTLDDKNNMWSIGANVRDEMEDIIPILVTRNFDCKKLAKDLSDGTSNTKIADWTNGDYKAPFSNKGFVMVRKGGAIFKARDRYVTIRTIYQGQSFKTTITGASSQNVFTYLGPKDKQDPSGGN
jgi:prepilin-type N-terminal cleavage/methylation domain-containing protein